MFVIFRRNFVQCFEKQKSFIKLSVLSFHKTSNSFSLNEEKTNESKNNFKYSLNENSKLSLDQQNFYEENGFLIVKSLVEREDINKYLNRFRDIANRKVPKPTGLMIQKEVSVAKEHQNENTVYKIQELNFDKTLFEYCTYPPILDYVEAFCGPNLMAIQTMLINKPPDKGSKSSRHPLHQDLHYFPFRPAERIIGTWTAMEAINRANGCLVVIPGSHRGQHLEHDYPEWEGGVNKLYYGVKGITEKEISQRIHLEMECGDTIFFHPLLIHGSGINQTKGFRKAIACHYAASECHCIDVKGTIQEKSAKELMDTYGTKVFPGLKFDDFGMILKARIKLVRGERLNI